MTARIRKTVSSQNMGNIMAVMLDDRTASQKRLVSAQTDLTDIENQIKQAIIVDPKGFENMLDVNWNKLYRLFGG